MINTKPIQLTTVADIQPVKLKINGVKAIGNKDNVYTKICERELLSLPPFDGNIKNPAR